VNFSKGNVKKSEALEVLVVDDEPLIRWSLVETLAAAGHTVIEACDRVETLRALSERARRPDVVILDYRLPDSNDLELLATIRRVAPRTQVIMMTAYGTSEIVNGALALGAFQVVSKPFEMHEVAALVQQAHDEGRE
jgi:DNA-binding NtrC family response regulator